MSELSQMHASPVSANTQRLTLREIKPLMSKIPGWELHNRNGERVLEKTFKFKDFDQAIAFTNRIAKVANTEDHHPSILTEWGRVTVTWWTHKIKGLSQNDFILAAKTDDLV